MSTKSTTTSHFIINKDTATGDWIFSGRVTDSDMVRLDLSPLDRSVIRQPAENAADHLQSLEILFRRIGEMNAKT